MGRDRSGLVGHVVVGVIALTAILSILIPVSFSGRASAYTLHPPIFIGGDSSFGLANGVVAGSGTPSDPYIIAGWEIDTTDAVGIEIRDTTAHFVIRDTYVRHLAPSPYQFSNHTGIVFRNVENGRVENSTVAWNSVAMEITDSWNVTIADSNISHSFYQGIVVGNSKEVSGNVTVSRNLLMLDEWGAIRVGSSGPGAHPVYGVTIDGNEGVHNAMDVIVEAVENLTIAGNYFHGAAVGEAVNVSSCTGGAIVGNTFEGPDKTLDVWDSTDFAISSNRLVDGWFFGGLHVFTSARVAIEHNYLGEMNQGIIVGYSREILVEHNDFWNVTRAMRVTSSTEVMVAGNTVPSHHDSGAIGLLVESSANVTAAENAFSSPMFSTGVKVVNSTGGLFYHNNFFYSEFPVGTHASDDRGSENAWNATYPIGGNYWSNYTGIDLMGGPGQDLPGPDGFGDTPNMIDGDSRDNYPLMAPWSPPPSNDTTPPTIADVRAEPDPQMVGGIVTVSAVVWDDTAVSGAWLDVSGVGNATMAYGPGTGRYALARTYGTAGVYTFAIWAADSAGNWACAQGEFTIRDPMAPTIADVRVEPDPQEVGGVVTVSAAATDNVQVRLVSLDLAGIGNVTMAWDPGSARYVDSRTYPVVGSIPFTIWATDDAGNAASTAGTVRIVDTTDPTIADVRAEPRVQVSGGVVNVSAAIADNYALEATLIEVRDPSGTPIVDEPLVLDLASGRYFLARPYAAPGRYAIALTARDTSGNEAWEAGTFNVTPAPDVTPPKIVTHWATPDPQEAFGTVRIETYVSDDRGVSSVRVAVTSPSGSDLGNATMVFDGTVYVHVAVYREPGVHAYCLWAVDATENGAKACGAFTVWDTTPPALTGVRADPDPAGPGTRVTITATASDRVGVTSVEVAIRGPPGTLLGTYPMVPVGGDRFAYAFEPAALGIYSFEVSTRDASGNENRSGGTFTVRTPDATLPPAIVVAGGTAVVAGVIFSLTEIGRVALLTILLSTVLRPRFQRKDNPEMRGMVRGYVRVHPGDTYTDIARNLGLNNGTLTWHLMKLQKEGLIVSRMRDGRKRYYPTGTPLATGDAVELHEVQRLILKAVEQDPGIPVRILAEQVGVSAQLALYHLRKLARRGGLSLERGRMRLRAYPSGHSGEGCGGGSPGVHPPP